MITVASLRSYLASTRRKRNTIPVTEQLPSAPTLKLVAGADETGVDKLDLTVEALKENPGITDEELAVVLGLKRPASAFLQVGHSHNLLHT